MNRLAALLPSVAVLVVLWQECGENPPLFCYRIGVGALAAVRSRAQLAARANAPERATRNRFPCSNPSGICFTRSMTSKD